MPLLGCIADDFTGATDLANTLVRGGMTAVQVIGVPEGALPEADAVVIALKSRTTPAADAVRDSLAALDALRAAGCRQFFFKYCSTFDSTPEGNIGPVLEALMARLDAPRALVCPAFPAAGRSVYGGHLFVGDQLLAESSMRHHPLTPMTDSDIRRWLQRQSRGRVGHVGARDVFGGAEAIRAAVAREAAAGRPLIVIDAVRDEDLRLIGEAARDERLLCGGSGIALGLPVQFGIRPAAGAGASWTGDPGPAAILSGSCSAMTRAQVERYRASGAPTLEIAPDDLVRGTTDARAAARWALARTEASPLVTSSADPDTVRAAQDRHGREHVAGVVEGFFAELARELTANGVRRLVTAGGETSGAVVEGLRPACRRWRRATGLCASR